MKRAGAKSRTSKQTAIGENLLNSQPLNVEEVFLQAVHKDPEERPAFLQATCADRKVRMRVEALLKAHDSAGTFLDGPAVWLAPLASAPESRAEDRDTASAQEPLDFLDPCSAPDRLGLLAHYEILDIVGRGGMGTVLRAVDGKLNRVVAIKVLAPLLAANAMARQRFQREAQAAAAVGHHHVVAIYAVDEFNGLPYLVMEYISGSSLQQKIDDSGALQLAQILRIGTQIASGLAAAHAQGLVHRDIKPANILLENGIERVKISDFGLARSIDDVQITQAGVVYGTPLYMSPEQAQGERVDQRSDLFSVGSVLYAMCTGRPPFRGDTGLAVLKRVCDDTPRPIREVNPDIPPALVQIVNKLLAKNPDARFQSAGEVAELLRRYLVHLQHDPLTPFQGEGQTQPVVIREGRLDGSGRNNGRPKHRAVRSQRRLLQLVGAAVLLMGIAVLGALEGARITNLTGLAGARMTSTNAVADAVPLLRPAGPSQSTQHAAGAADRPVKVFILAGDSNMAGRAKVALLKYQANQAGTRDRFQHLLHDGEWGVRADVWIKNFHQKGNLTVGFGQSPDRFGPELEFGHVVGDYFDEQVLLIKTCWGGSTVLREFRSPSAGLPSPEALELLRKELQKLKADATLADVERTYGTTYREMVKEVQGTLANLGEHFPSYQGQGFEMAGFVWFSGWNDMVAYNPYYAEQLAHFIRDLRGEFKTPNLPFVIGQLGVLGTSDPGTNESNFRAAQAAVAQLPEFTGNVQLVATDPFWDQEAHAVYKKGSQNHKDEWDKVGSDAPYHYLGSARTFCAIGKAFGEAMIALRRSGAKD
jgi:serine/threonine protein kinase